MKALNRIVILAVAGFLLIGAISSYRAWYQIKGIKLLSNEIMRPGATIDAFVDTYGRTPVDLRVELIQGATAETIARYQLPANRWAFFNPRVRHFSRRIYLTNGILDGFTSGQALLRVTAVGRPQWTRLPPPLVTEKSVQIQL